MSRAEREVGFRVLLPSSDLPGVLTIHPSATLRDSSSLETGGECQIPQPPRARCPTASEPM